MKHENDSDVVRMTVVVEPHTLTQTASGSLIGTIWLRSDRPPDIDFPETGWTDFPVVILGWWLAQVDALRRGASAEAECSFMDGPFEFRINKVGELRLLKSGASGLSEIAKRHISLEAFWQQLHVAALHVVSECDRRGFSSDDVVELRRFVAGSGYLSKAYSAPTEQVLDPADRVVTRLPLEQLWNKDGDVAATRWRRLDRAAIRDLLGRGPVQFVVADVGRQLRWIPESERFRFWKADGTVHLADGERVDLLTFPDGIAYTASEWTRSPDGVPIVLLETHH
jgi:hypothetical protein